MLVLHVPVWSTAYSSVNVSHLLITGGKAPKASAVEAELQKIDFNYRVIEPSKFSLSLSLSLSIIHLYM